MRLVKFLIVSLAIHILVLAGITRFIMRENSFKKVAQGNRVELKVSEVEKAEVGPEEKLKPETVPTEKLKREKKDKAIVKAPSPEPQEPKETTARFRPDETQVAKAEEKDLSAANQIQTGKSQIDEIPNMQETMVKVEKKEENSVDKTPEAQKPIVKQEKQREDNKEKMVVQKTDADKVKKERNVEDKKDRMVVKDTETDKKIVKTKFRTKDDYFKYKSKMNVSQIEGLPVPDLVVIYSDKDEILTVTDYFNLRLVVYAREDGKESPVLIEVENPDTPVFRHAENIKFVNYSNRVRERQENPFFDDLLEKAVKEFGIQKHKAHLISLIPNDIDLYFRYKQIESVRREGIDPFSVKVTYARYHLTDIGVWILAIEKLKLKDGRTVSVTDFELKELSSNHPS